MPYFIFDNFDATIANNLARFSSHIQHRVLLTKNSIVRPELKKFTQRDITMPITFVKACGIFSRYVKRSTAYTYIYICIYVRTQTRFVMKEKEEGEEEKAVGPQRGTVKLRIPTPWETSISIKSC